MRAQPLMLRRKGKGKAGLEKKKGREEKGERKGKAGEEERIGGKGKEKRMWRGRERGEGKERK